MIGERARGFTLIELLVVMLIIASLLTIAMPRYFRSIEHSKETVLAQDLAVLRDAIDKFYSDRGLYPEALKRLRSVLRKDHFVDYCEQGKRSYYIASTYDAEPYREEAPVLRRLSEQFEVCAFGLSQLRKEWERRPPALP